MGGPNRILHVLGGLNRGGAETMVMNIYRNIDRSKIQFDFMIHTTDKGEFDDEIYELGGRIYSIQRYYGKNHFEYKKLWSDFYKKHSEYRIIHGHMRSTAAIYLKIAKKYGLLTIAHSHSTSSGSGFSAMVKNILQYPIRYTADYLFACSESAGTWLFGKKACGKNNFFIKNNAIDAKKFIFDIDMRRRKRKEFDIENNFVIGHVGRFHTPKNHGFLINVFKAIHDKNPNSILLLVGDGELRHSIEKKVNYLGLANNVIFTGVRSDISELLQTMDVFLFPSLYEGLGIAVIEAQAAGLMTIVSDALPVEVKVTDSIRPISLKKSPEYWAEKILLYKDGYERKDTSKAIISALFDIKENAKWLEEFYLKKLR